MKKKRKHTRNKKHIFKVMWTYYDSQGNFSGVIDIEAYTRKGAENEFYKINRKYIIGYNESDNSPVFNPKGGYVCESVLTEAEWVAEGSPTEV